MIYTTQRRRFVYDTWDNGSRIDCVMVECTWSITRCFRLNLQLHTIDLVRTCRISSFCTVAWQLARFQLTRRIARSLSDSWASCLGRQNMLSYANRTSCVVVVYFFCWDGACQLSGLTLRCHTVLTCRPSHNWCYNKAGSNGWRNWCKRHLRKPLTASQER